MQDKLLPRVEDITIIVEIKPYFWCEYKVTKKIQTIIAKFVSGHNIWIGI